MFLDIVMGRKNQVGLALSPRAVAVLDELARHMEASRADVIEAIAHAQLALETDTPKWSFSLVHEEAQTTVQSRSTSSDTQATESSTIPVEEPDTEPSQVAPASSSEVATETAPPAPETATAPPPAAPEPDAAATQALETLQQEKADLQAQLDETRSRLQQLQSPPPPPFLAPHFSTPRLPDRAIGHLRHHRTAPGTTHESQSRLCHFRNDAARAAGRE
jgi:hypothetical protein